MTEEQVLAKLVNEMVEPEATKHGVPQKAIPHELVAVLAKAIVRGGCTWGAARTMIEALAEIAAC